MRHGHTVVGIMELRYHLAKHGDGIGYRATIVPAMQILVRPRHLHFEVGQPAHAAIDARHLVADHGGVGDEAYIGLQEILVLAYPRRKAQRAYLLLPFEDEFHIMVKQPAAHLLLEGLQMHEELTLVVVGAAAPYGPVVNDRLEGIAVPFVQRLGRLDVVMPIDQNRFSLRINDFLSEDDRVARAWTDLRFVSSRL